MEYERRVWLTNIALAALLIFCVAIVVLALLLVRRHSRLREEAEALLAEREQRLRLTLEAAEAGAWDLDVPRQRLRCHDLCAQILDFGHRPEISLDDFLAKLHREDAAEVSSKFTRMLANPSEGFYQSSFRIVLGDGSLRWIHMRTAPYLRHDGPRIVGVAMDVTRAREAQMKIQELLAQTQELLSQKETLVREIDHRVKNSLQLAASTLSVQARLEKDGRVRHGLMQAEQRLHAMAQVHKIIQESEYVGEVSFGTQVEKLAAEFAQLSESMVDIECHGDKVFLPPRKALSLAVIVNELLMNVLKHTGSQQRVHVAIAWHLHKTQLVLTVRDDGPGMPENASESGDGFGKRMILGLVKQLKGSLKVHSDHTGTSYEITVPLPHEPMFLH
jgi:two-component sensor histidine kinase